MFCKVTGQHTVYHPLARKSASSATAVGTLVATPALPMGSASLLTYYLYWKYVNYLYGAHPKQLQGTASKTRLLNYGCFRSLI